MKRKFWVIGGVLLFFGITMTINLYKKRHTDFLSPKKGNVVEAIYGLGKVQSDQVFEVKIGVMTNITRLEVKEGDLVQQGQLLVSFDGVANFLAPFSGTVTAVNFNQGEIALPQVPILRIEDLNQKYIEVSLEQDAALKVRERQKAKIIFESLTSKVFLGEVKRIYPKSGEFLTRIEVKSLGPFILPGMSADVVIEVGKRNDVLLIPLRAISAGRVTRLRNGKKTIIDIQIGHADGAWGELLQGDLALTDQLVVKGK